MKGFCTILLLLISSLVLGQNNLQLQYGFRGSLASAKFLPSTLDLQSKKWQVGLNYKLWISNRALSYGSIKDVQSKGTLSTSDVDLFISQLNKQNRIGFGQDVMLIGLSFNSVIASKQVAWGISVSDRMTGSFRYPKTLIRLAWKGNKQFEGATIDIAGSLDARYFREYALTAATNIIHKDDFRLRVGGSLKYYQGIAAVYMPQNFLKFTTDQDGDFIAFDYNYDVFIAGVEEFDMLKTTGIGYGGNVGASLHYKDRWVFEFGLSDLGRIEYNRNTSLFRGDGSIRFDGIGRDDFRDLESYADSVVAIYENEVVVGESFAMPLGMRLQLQSVYQLTRDKGKSDNVYFTYIQGFRELPGISTRPRFTMGYNQNMLKWLRAGVNVSYGGFNNLTIGGLLAVDVGKSQFGFMSDDFTGAILPDRGTGVGFGFVYQVTF